MSDAKLYYTPPSETVFEDMKKVATSVWNTYDNEYGYATEKIQRIENMKNVGDNFMYIFAMFDMDNQRIVVDGIQEETRMELRQRMVDGGNSELSLSLIGL